jgi:ubiquinone/menaquinone biosynthesis C-methylase UbiE
LIESEKKPALKQNIYDVPGFFKGYQRMRNSQTGLNEMVEQMAILSLLPDVNSMAVLDLGCGAGDLCRRIQALGARQTIGVDISANMLELARKDAPSGVTFQQKAMEDLDFGKETFDLVVSSLAFHYVADLPKLLKNIYKILKPSGWLLFSIEHPVLTCSQGIHHGWVKDSSGKKLCWPVDCYSDEGKRESHWFVEGVIKYHRTISTIFNSLIGAGFTLKAVAEPTGTDEDERIWPELKDVRRRPSFLIVKAIK